MNPEFKKFSSHEQVWKGNQFLFNPRGRDRTRFDLIKWNDIKGKSVLDLGCNNGLIALEAKRRGASKVLGVDILDSVQAAEALAKEEGLDVEFWQTDIESKEFKNFCPKFDVVFFCAVLSHLKNGKEMIDWIDRHTREVLYFETNSFHDVKKQFEEVRDNTSFHDYKYLGKSGNKRGPKEAYSFFRCSRDKRDTRQCFRGKEVHFINLDRIPAPKGGKLRNEWDDILRTKVDRLKKKIQKLGIRQPLICQSCERGKFKFRGIEGGHRFLAAKELGYKSVPYIIASREEILKEKEKEKND